MKTVLKTIVQTPQVLFSVFKTIFESSLPNTFLKKKQQKTIFCFCSRKQFSNTKTETGLPNEL